MENRSAAEIASPEGCPKGVSEAKQSSNEWREMASATDSTGVVTGRGMCEEKRKDEPIFHSRHLELGRPGM